MHSAMDIEVAMKIEIKLAGCINFGSILDWMRNS
jgi:hypothetical protein